MIRNEDEYREAVNRLVAEKERIEDYEARLHQEGLKAGEVARALQPIRSFHDQLCEEVESYEKLKRRDIGELRSLRGRGYLLVCLRIAQGTSQRELADRLGVHESQVLRDERNDYHGITLEGAARILEALDVDVCIDFNITAPVTAA